MWLWFSFCCRVCLYASSCLSHSFFLEFGWRKKQREKETRAIAKKTENIKSNLIERLVSWSMNLICFSALASMRSHYMWALSKRVRISVWAETDKRREREKKNPNFKVIETKTWAQNQNQQITLISCLGLSCLYSYVRVSILLTPAAAKRHKNTCNHNNN